MSDQAEATGNGFTVTDHLSKMKSGKMYLDVWSRIQWIDSLCPEREIVSWDVRHIERHIDFDQGRAYFVLELTLHFSNGTSQVAQATGSETKGDFGDYIEKAETKALGRACGMLAKGTAAAMMADQDYIVDSPRDTEPANRRQADPQPEASAEPSAPRALTDQEWVDKSDRWIDAYCAANGVTRDRCLAILGMDPVRWLKSNKASLKTMGEFLTSEIKGTVKSA